MEINGTRYADGGLGYNNPVLLTTKEAKECFGINIHFDLILSIGTGTAPRTFIERYSVKGIPAAMIGVATNCENHHYIMRDNADLLSGIGTKKYVRFNLTPKLGDPEWYEA